MASEFVDIHRLLHQVRAELILQEAMYREVTSTDFDPLVVSFEGLSRFEITAEEVINDVTTEALADEAETQINFIVSCFDRLKTAMVIMEAQCALARRPSFAGDRQVIESCLEQDHEAVRKGFDQIGILRAYQKDKLFPRVVDEQSMAKDMSDVTTQYRAINKGHLSLKFNVQFTPGELLEKIFEQRIDYAIIAAEDLVDTLAKTHDSMRDGTYLKIAIDEGVIPQGVFIQKMIDEKFGYAGRRLGDTRRILTNIQDYMADLYGMGEGNYGRGVFDVRRYKPVTIDGLDQLAP